MQTRPTDSLLLKGVVGSQAFGLAHEGSDYDFQGIFVAPTQAFLGLSKSPQESFSYSNPDTTYHEVGKYCRLALKCNPTILDLLWLDEHNVRTQLGTELINMRNNFLSAKYVRDAYFGYAMSQIGKLDKDSRAQKRAKNARHFLRLLQQGAKLYRTGKLEVKLPNANDIKFYADLIAEGNKAVSEKAIEIAERDFNKPSVLPEQPNFEVIDQWLLKVRHEFYKYTNQGSSDSVEKFKVWPG